MLGFDLMPRSTIPFPGYWLGVAGRTQIHMGQAGDPLSEQYYLGSVKGRTTRDSGVVDHIAFTGEDAAGFRARLEGLGVPFQTRNFPEAKLFQILVEDPNGLIIEVGFFDDSISKQLDDPAKGQPGQ